MSIIAAERSAEEIVLQRKDGGHSRIKLAPNPELTRFLAGIDNRICTYSGQGFVLIWSSEDRFFVLGLDQSANSVSVERVSSVASRSILECLCQIGGMPLSQAESKIDGYRRD